MIRGILAAAAAATCVSAAQADVVYNWTTIEPGNVPPFSAQLIVSDAAYLSGSLRERYQSGGCSLQEGCTTPETTRLVSFVIDRDGFDLLLDFRQGVVVGGARPVESFDLEFLPNGRLTGSMQVTDTNSDYAFAGEGQRPNLWTVVAFAADDSQFRCGSLSGATVECTTAGGWTIDRSTQPRRVPEPGTMPLIALACAGLGLGLQRRRAA